MVVLLPLVTLLLEFLLFGLSQPYVWLAFLPAVAGAAWLCGLRGGLLAMVLSMGLAEWLLALPLPLPGMTASAGDDPRASLVAAVLFSVLAISVVFSLQRFRREKFALYGASGALWSQLSLKGVDVTDAESLMRALPAEFAWREAVLAELPLGVAVYSAQGQCLRANAMFARCVGLSLEEVLKATLFGGILPVDGLAAAAQRLVATATFEHLDEVIRSDGKLYRLHWIAQLAEGLIMFTVQDNVPHGAANLPLAPAPADVPVQVSAPSSRPFEPRRPLSTPRDALPRTALPQTLPIPAPGPPALDGLRCLIVDDQRLNRDLLGEILRLEGAVPTLCASGAEAVLAVASGRAQFDVVLMDIQMPGMDGFQATRQIRSLPGAADLPIFAVTADGAGTNQAALQAADMQGLLGKPLDVDHLVALLRQQPRA